MNAARAKNIDIDAGEEHEVCDDISSEDLDSRPWCGFGGSTLPAVEPRISIAGLGCILHPVHTHGTRNEEFEIEIVATRY